MDMTSIGKNIRRFRTEKKMMQETLAEMTNLSANYIGMLERGEKIPSLTSLIHIANALGITADMLLCDVLSESYHIKCSLMMDRIATLPLSEQQRIYAVVDTMIQSAEENAK